MSQEDSTTNYSSSNTKLVFEEVPKKSLDKSSVWHYFLRESKGQHAKCKVKECQKILHNGTTTTSLHIHLKSKHNVILAKAPQCPQEPGASIVISKSRFVFTIYI